MKFSGQGYLGKILDLVWDLKFLCFLVLIELQKAEKKRNGHRKKKRGEDRGELNYLGKSVGEEREVLRERE